MKIIKAKQVKIVQKEKHLATGFQKIASHGVTDGKPYKDWKAEREHLEARFSQELQNRETTAFERGREVGRREAEERYRLEEKKKVDALVNILENLTAARRDLITNCEEDLLTLAFTMAEKIIHYTIDSDREAICHILRSTLRDIVDRNNLTIRLNSDDYRYMMEIKSVFLKDFNGMKNVSFQEDPSVARGGAIVEMPFGEVDVRIEQQLKEMKNALLNSR